MTGFFCGLSKNSIGIRQIFTKDEGLEIDYPLPLTTRQLLLRCSTTYIHVGVPCHKNNGGPSATRTRDHRIKSPVLYQLS